ncbi:ketoacyl-ACP synthase III [Desulfuromonas carbonis]|uniref:3-oxoacyl-ACP synthase III family protein n=1 Tax=Desulfuromonas sp. DDH964 TaxID=1823759 RepID=UPI00078C9242|nr:ketoacyl-ACP synthase III [Desulfuromonas sp. DDH964]AMV73042.1 3-oxoacyl-ACP synthase [Desulfuromonas sp. DDH964]
MLGIAEIGSYIPENRISNYDRKEQFAIDDQFIEEKIGVRSVSRKGPEEETSDLCLKAYADLEARSGLRREEVETLVVVTQNPDFTIPHTSALVHGRLGLAENCACFDISLGCSGFVYGLSTITAFMAANGLRKGVLITADPYSKVVSPDDKNTALLFGDAAGATLISNEARFVPGHYTFGTLGSEFDKLIARDGVLFMNGRAVFNFAAKTIPPDIEKMAAKNGIAIADIDRFLFHQGSKIIVETIARKLGVPLTKVPYAICDFGNSCASTIPLLLQSELADPAVKTIAISGFGVGLSWASGLLRRVA